MDASDFENVPTIRSTSSARPKWAAVRSEEHTSELQSQSNLVCRLLLEKKNKIRPCADLQLYPRLQPDVLSRLADRVHHAHQPAALHHTLPRARQPLQQPPQPPPEPSA